ncbi:hypothetical protein [Psychromonas sp. Urea-02u-13]|nr:hypothetical protein [Psychromonas sp. Urea-02u-13]
MKQMLRFFETKTKDCDIDHLKVVLNQFIGACGMLKPLKKQGKLN